MVIVFFKLKVFDFGLGKNNESPVITEIDPFASISEEVNRTIFFTK